MFDNLTDDNFYLYAAKYYENPNCLDIEEFNEDVNRIKYIKRLFNRYQQKGELKERLIINHLVILYNVFDHVALTRMLALKLCDQLDLLKPFLLMLGYWPLTIDGINGINILCSEVPVDSTIVKTLRKI